MNAQSNHVTGEYYLRGVMEVGSGFKLDPDSSFQFFFAYGALDRSGTGTWSVKDKKVILNSKPWSGSDFALISSKKTDAEGITIQVVDSNTIFLGSVFAMLISDGKQYEQQSSREGIIRFPVKEIDSLKLAFEFSGERISTIILPDLTHNEFRFKFEPWILDVYFKDLSLDITSEGLEGQHPLLKKGSYRFVKN